MTTRSAAPTRSTTPGPDASSRVDARLHASAGGVSIVLDCTDGRLPAIVHWGAELGTLSAQDVDAMVLGDEAIVAPNTVDIPLRASLLPEQARGWSGRPGLSGSRAGRGWAPRFIVQSVLADDQPVHGFLEMADGRIAVSATDVELGLDLLIEIELLASGLLRTRATVTNQAGEPYTLDDLVLAYPVPVRAHEVLDFGGRWGKEKVAFRSDLTQGQHVREGRKGRTGADAAGVLHVGEAGFGFAAGEIWGVHVGFSGNHTHYAERTFNGAQVVGGGELLLPGEIQLAQGEDYRTPWVYGAYGVGLDQVAGRFHRWLRSRPQHPDAARPVTLNVWEAVYFDHDLDRLLDLAERAADLGVERFVLDDGWFGGRRNDHAGLGDWFVSPQVWPNGLHPLIERVHELGMQFGLWFEPEMVNPDSDLARAHPEWVCSARPRSAQPGPVSVDGWPVESRFQQVLNLAIPEAYAHVRDAIFALLAEYDIAYIKWDHNRDLVEAGNQLDGGRPIVHEQTLAYYRLVAEIKAAHPGLEIESCASGGGRVDLGVMEHCDRVWTSDCIDPLERQQMNRWTMQLLPPELLGSHIASGRSHTTGRVHDLGFRAGTAAFGHLGIEWDLAQASVCELDQLRAWITWYRANREHLLTGDLVRVDTGDDTLNVYGSVSHDRSRAIYFYATIGRSDLSPRARVRFPGLEPARRYRVAPVIIGDPPSGLRLPGWWTGGAWASGANEMHADVALTGHEAIDLSGIVLPGSVLSRSGLQAPALDPDQIIIFEVVAEPF